MISLHLSFEKQSEAFILLADKRMQATANYPLKIYPNILVPLCKYKLLMIFPSRRVEELLIRSERGLF